MSSEPRDENALNAELPVGARIAGFEILKFLGGGTESRVYLARELAVDRLVTLKISASAAHEAYNLAALDHENIVRLHTQVELGRYRLLVMQFVPAVPLAQVLEHLSQRSRDQWRSQDIQQFLREAVAGFAPFVDTLPSVPMTTERFERLAGRMVLQVARALAYAHSRGVLHRDIKPENILVTSDGRVLLTDFNVAVRLTPDADQRTQIVGGTLAYMSPEHLASLAWLSDVETAGKDIGPVDAASDLYSLGIVFFELLTGYRPFPLPEATGTTAATCRALLAERLKGPPPFPATGLKLPTVLQSIVAKCLNPRRDGHSARYRTADELVEDLERFLADQPPRHAADGPWSERAARFVRRHRFACSVGLSLALAITFAWGAWAYHVAKRLNRIERDVASRLAAAVRSDAEIPEPAMIQLESELEGLSRISLFPDVGERRARLFHDFGLLCVETERPERAAEWFRRAIAEDGTLAEAYNNLGVVYFQLRQYEAALSALDQAITLGYRTADAFANRGAARAALGDLPGSLQDLDHALVLDPNHAAAQRNRDLVKKLLEERQ
ncbi:MAG: protein kinase [Planctomycetes bacterium]|nr:protein kinase [Planctomycetota bacterium]